MKMNEPRLSSGEEDIKMDAIQSVKQQPVKRRSSAYPSSGFKKACYPWQIKRSQRSSASNQQQGCPHSPQEVPLSSNVQQDPSIAHIISSPESSTAIQAKTKHSETKCGQMDICQSRIRHGSRFVGVCVSEISESDLCTTGISQSSVKVGDSSLSCQTQEVSGSPSPVQDTQGPQLTSSGATDCVPTMSSGPPCMCSVQHDASEENSPAGHNSHSDVTKEFGQNVHSAVVLQEPEVFHVQESPVNSPAVESKSHNAPSESVTPTAGAAPSRQTSVLQRWQNHHLAKAVVDNAINKTLEEMGLSPGCVRTLYTAQQQQVEDVGVSEAIKSWGLRNRNQMHTDNLRQFVDRYVVERLTQGITQISDSIFTLMQASESNPVLLRDERPASALDADPNTSMHYINALDDVVADDSTESLMMTDGELGTIDHLVDEPSSVIPVQSDFLPDCQSQHQQNYNLLEEAVNAVISERGLSLP